jgi:hypothetical protein
MNKIVLERGVQGGILKWGSDGNGVIVSTLSVAIFCFFQDCEFIVFPPD